jgi:tRNA pseudouridine38-40 synthase
MRKAARFLVGEHDFASFCRPPAGSGTVRHLRRLSVRRAGEITEIRAAADAFLHQMVRSLVGTLVEVGRGRLDPDAMPTVLGARDRAAAGAVAPPDGLTLLRVRYGAHPRGPGRSRVSGER